MIWKHGFGKNEQGLERYETMNVFGAAEEDEEDEEDDDNEEDDDDGYSE